MKKIIAMLLTLTMVFAFCVCGQTAALAASAEEYTEITLKLSHHNAVDQPIHTGLTKWAELVNERTGGKVTVDIYPAASMYNSQDAEDAVKMGTLDMCLGDCSQLSNSLPAYALTCLPFLFDSYETADEIMYGEIGTAIDQMAVEQLGIVPLGWTWNGFRNMCTKDPITSVADCHNYKLRSPGSQIYLDTFNTLGMSPTVVTWSEAYTSMQSGMVDGVESGLEAFYTQGFYELGKNICLSRHMISIIGPIINADKWNSINEATQAVMMEAWAECQAELNETVIAGEESYQTKLEEAGCNITEFENRQELIDLYTSYWTESAEKGGYTDLLTQVLAVLNG